MFGTAAKDNFFSRLESRQLDNLVGPSAPEVGEESKVLSVSKGEKGSVNPSSPLKRAAAATVETRAFQRL